MPFKLQGPLAPRILLGSTYLFLILSIAFTTILICGCIPTSPGSPSALKSFYAVNLQVTAGIPHDIYIASYAICARIGTETACAVTVGKSADALPALLTKGVHPPALRTALKLQQDVYYNVPVVVALLFLCSLLCAITSDTLKKPDPQRMKIIAATFAGIATLIMLMDAYSTRLSVLALEIGSAGFEGMDYRAGIHWLAFQWMGFGCGVLGAGLLGVGGRGGKKAA